MVISLKALFLLSAVFLLEKRSAFLSFAASLANRHAVQAAKNLRAAGFGLFESSERESRSLWARAE